MSENFELYGCFKIRQGRLYFPIAKKTRESKKWTTDTHVICVEFYMKNDQVITVYSPFRERNGQLYLPIPKKTKEARNLTIESEIDCVQFYIGTGFEK